MEQLCQQNLSKLGSSVALPGYLSAPPKAGIVHLGLGQFAKAHLACYMDSVMDEGGGDWRIVGASLQSSTALERLQPQDNLFTVTSQSADVTAVRVIGSVAEVIAVSSGGRERLLDRLTDPSIHIVSLTVTEKGYYLNALGELDFSHPAIRADLIAPDRPNTAIGWVVLAAKYRQAIGAPPFTALSLDNLIGNGRVLRRVVLAFASRVDSTLAEYIESHVAFPSSMVDRIVPALDADALAATRQSIGMIDDACVLTEAFSQWVVEDRFVTSRPAWEKAGVIFCEDVAAFETMKLRLLNGAHSALAYIGILLGHRTVADCMDDPALRSFIESLMRIEIQPEVVPPVGFDLDPYIGQLLERFSNPHLRHLCSQIAMDGSQKIPQRLLPLLEERLLKGSGIHRLVFTLAAWMIFIEQQEPLLDPLGSKLKALAANNNDAGLVSALLTSSGVFSKALRNSMRLRLALTTAVVDIRQLGVAMALTKCVNSEGKST
ncbi:MAG: fructuronate reductase [Candidatus Azotimanducaceae bacterium]